MSLRPIMRKMEKKKHNPQELMKHYNKGLREGAVAQNKTDSRNLIGILQRLEKVPGIGPKTADKIRVFIIREFNRG